MGGSKITQNLLLVGLNAKATTTAVTRKINYKRAPFFEFLV